MESYAWFKLLLDPEQATKYDDPSLTRSEGAGVLNAPPGKSAVDLSADYLTEVAKFAYQSLAKRVSVEVLQATPVEFHFTVPAVWSDRAKMDTLRAARKAMKQANLKGQVDNKIVLIQEPEAAAVAALSTLTQGGSEQQVKANDSIMICDCGGGTVDITTYVIMSISPKLTFKELLVGTGM
jgi:molecular chaperone DnaK (HSP70)